MTTEPRLSDYLQHMQVAAEQTLAYIAGMDFAAFEADRRTQQAVLFNFVVLGEAAARVMDQHPDFVVQNAAVPWRAIRNTRNRVAHGYFRIDYAVLWETMAVALPALLAHLPAVIAAAGAPGKNPSDDMS